MAVATAQLIDLVPEAGGIPRSPALAAPHELAPIATSARARTGSAGQHGNASARRGENKGIFDLQRLERRHSQPYGVRTLPRADFLRGQIQQDGQRGVAARPGARWRRLSRHRGRQRR